MRSASNKNPEAAGKVVVPDSASCIMGNQVTSQRDTQPLMTPFPKVGSRLFAPDTLILAGDEEANIG
jgi:hypothetical protein